MICNHCGQDIPEDNQFCPNCGSAAPVSGVPDAGAYAQPAAEPNSYYSPNQNVYQQAGYVQGAAYQPYAQQTAAVTAAPAQGQRPAIQFSTHRGLCKMIFLGMLTCGIYDIVINYRIVNELNIAASRYDGRQTAGFFAMSQLSAITFGIYWFVWNHNFCDRIGAELRRRNCKSKFGAGDFWLWNLLGSMILVGPFIYQHKMLKAMNEINESFNLYG